MRNHQGFPGPQKGEHAEPSEHSESSTLDATAIISSSSSSSSSTAKAPLPLTFSPVQTPLYFSPSSSRKPSHLKTATAYALYQDDDTTETETETDVPLGASLNSLSLLDGSHTIFETNFEHDDDDSSYSQQQQQQDMMQQNVPQERVVRFANPEDYEYFQDFVLVDEDFDELEEPLEEQERHEQEHLQNEEPESPWGTPISNLYQHDEDITEHDEEEDDEEDDYEDSLPKTRVPWKDDYWYNSTEYQDFRTHSATRVYKIKRMLARRMLQQQRAASSDDDQETTFDPPKSVRAQRADQILGTLQSLVHALEALWQVICELDPATLQHLSTSTTLASDHAQGLFFGPLRDLYMNHNCVAEMLGLESHLVPDLAREFRQRRAAVQQLLQSASDNSHEEEDDETLAAAVRQLSLPMTVWAQLLAQGQQAPV